MRKEYRTVPLSEIKPYPNNPRINDEAAKDVAKSIKQCGYIAPIVVDEDMVILAGHTRAKALESLGRTEADIIIVSGLSDAKKRKYRLLDNKTQESAEWDFDLLEQELDGLDFGDLELDWGLDLDDEPTEAVEDDYDAEPPEEPRAKMGDIYQLGRHRLMCGDSTKREDVERLVRGADIQLLLTDPPYGVDIVKGGTVGGDKPFGRTKSDNGAPVSFGTASRPKSREIVPATEYIPIKGDDTTETAQKSYEIAKDIAKVQVIFGGNYFTEFLPPSRCWIVWDKGVPDKAFFAPVELAWCSKDGNAKLYKRLWSGSVREGSRGIEGKRRIHPTQKPVSLCSDILNDFSTDGDNIMDLFGGSGSTLMACEQLNRTCYMMEYEPRYIDTIIDRFEKFTNQKAVKIGG